jgi:hypothetical protein
MSNTGRSVKNEAIREVAFGSITGSYASLGVPLVFDALSVTFFNDTDAAIYISTDASTDHMKFPAQSGTIKDHKTNDMYRKALTQFSIKYDTAPTSGSFWIEVEYA